MNTRFAIIDLGTNTFHLLVAEKQGTKASVLHREKVGVKLGKAGINQNIIQPDAIERAVTALQAFKNKMNTFGVSAVHAFGTSAFRNAENSREVIEQIKNQTGITVRILSGAEEAEMIYRGVASAVNITNDTGLIMDIGAGSVEFILADQHQSLWSKSVELGAQRIIEMFSISDPITPEEVKNINSVLDQSLREVDEAVIRWKPKTLIGSSGSFDTLSDMYCREYGIPVKESDPETPLTIDFVRRAHEKIIHSTRAERLLLPGMIELRVDLIVVGSCMVKYILDKYQISQIRVSRYSLKEGALAMLSE